MSRELHDPGDLLASASEDQTVRLQTDQGATLGVLGAHTRTSLPAFSPDSSALAVVDDRVRLWNLREGSLRTLGSHDGNIEALAYAPDGSSFLSASDDGGFRLWDATGTLRRKSQVALAKRDPGAPLMSAVVAVAYAPDGKTTASGSASHVIVVRDLEGRTLRELVGHTDVVTSIAFSPDGRRMASSSIDGTARLWAVDGTPLQVLRGHGAKVGSVAFSPDGRTLASAGADKMVRLWDASTGAPLKVLEGHTWVVMRVEYAPDGKTIASGAMDGTVRIWDADGTPRKVLVVDGAFVSFSRDGRFLAAGSSSVSLFATASWTKLGTLRGARDLDAGYVFDDAAIELLGPDAEKLRAFPVCAFGGAQTFLFELCAGRFETPGLLGSLGAPNGTDAVL